MLLYYSILIPFLKRNKLKRKLTHFIKETSLLKLVLLFFILFTSVYFALRVFLLPPSSNTLSYTNNNFSYLGLNIPSHLEFCGEKIPANNYAIANNLEKEFFSDTYWQKNATALFSKAQKWFPYIEPILKKEGVPDDFKYVAIIESHLSNIVSPAGAAGFWQIVPSSAGKYGLEVNEFVDERYHVEKSTVAACKLFKEAYSVFKNWTLAAAAYNRGIGGIQSALKKQNAESYYQLLLNNETGSFVYRILAYKTLFYSPKHFGIKKKKWKYLNPIPFKIYKVDSTITDLKFLAEYAKCSKAMIKLFNPWILGNELPNPDGKTYSIRVPKNLKADYSSYLRDLNGEDGDLNMDPESAPVKVIQEVKDTLKQN